MIESNSRWKKELTRRRLITIGATGAITALLGATSLSLFRRNKSRSTMQTNSENKKIKIVFDFAPHSTASHAEQISRLLRKHKPHVVCLENAGSSEAISMELEDRFIAGIDTGLNLGEYGVRLRDVLRREGVPRVFFLERFAEEKVQKLRNRLNVELPAHLTHSVELFFKGKSEEALPEFKKGLEAYASVQTERNNEVRRTLSSLHRYITKRYPELKKESKLTLVVSYGMAHAPIIDHARTVGFGEVIGKKPNIDVPMRYLPPKSLFSLRREWDMPRAEGEQELAKLLILGIISGRIFDLRAVPYQDSARHLAHEAVKSLTLRDFHVISRDIDGALKAGTSFEESISRVFQRNRIFWPRTPEDVHVFARERNISLVPEEYTPSD